MLQVLVNMYQAARDKITSDAEPPCIPDEDESSSRPIADLEEPPNDEETKGRKKWINEYFGNLGEEERRMNYCKASKRLCRYFLSTSGSITQLAYAMFNAEDYQEFCRSILLRMRKFSHQKSESNTPLEELRKLYPTLQGNKQIICAKISEIRESTMNKFQKELETAQNPKDLLNYSFLTLFWELQHLRTGHSLVLPRRIAPPATFWMSKSHKDDVSAVFSLQVAVMCDYADNILDGPTM